MLTGTFAWTANAVQAQTHFYLNQIEVLPASPSAQDQVQLQLSGDLSNTGASITGATAQVTGFTVALAVSATSTGGMDVLVPHTEVVDVGMLPAGDYTITIGGPGMQDLAPQDQHHFTVTGGATACDSLVIAGLSWMPFSDTALLVHVLNPTATVFDYPGFVLLADNGDTLAKETVNAFGIGQETYNIMTIPVGTAMPASPFNATLQLWTGFYQDLACSWELPIGLCPPDSCTRVLANVQNYGGGPATGTFLYNVREGGTMVANGSFLLTDGQQSDQDTLCLPPGHYLMEIIPQQGPNGGQLHFGVDRAFAVPGPHAPVIWTTLSAVAFTLYEHCIDIGQGLSETMPALLGAARSATGMELFTTDGRALGQIQVFDAQGRLVRTADEPRSQRTFNTAGWARGLFVFRTRDADGRALTVRWMNE